MVESQNQLTFFSLLTELMLLPTLSFPLLGASNPMFPRQQGIKQDAAGLPFQAILTLAFQPG